MDYDGQNQHQVTHLGSISLSPRISPDNSRIAFSSLARDGWAIRMYSLDLGRMVSFPGGTAGGSNLSPAWSSDGTKIAFSSSRSGDSEIWVADASGGNLHRVTSLAGPNVSPMWNPRTNAQMAFVGGRTGEPQIYTMDQDGSNVQRMTDSGYAVSPSWAPNGGLSDLQLESQVWAGRSGRAGHLCDRHCEQALAAGDARVGQQRFSVVGAGWTAYCVSEDDREPRADLDDAGRRHASAATDASGRQLDAQLELGSETVRTPIVRRTQRQAGIAPRRWTMILRRRNPNAVR